MRMVHLYVASNYGRIYINTAYTLEADCSNVSL